MNLNKVFLIGRMAADPEARTTQSGQTVVSLRVATNRIWNYRDNQRREQTEFHAVVAWGKLGDIAQKYLVKGQLAFFEGRLQTRSWQGADGVKRYRTEIVAENLQLGPKSTSGGFVREQTSRQPESKPTTKLESNEEIPIINEESPVTNPVVSDSEVEESEIDLKDIPF